MNHKNEIRVGVKFETDNSQLDISRQKFKELMTFLKDIQDDARQPGLGTQMKKELIEAAQEAKKLEDILNSAWNEKLNKMDFSKFNLSIKQSYGSMSQLKASLESAGPSGASAFNQLSNAILSSNTQLRKTNNLLDKMSLTMANTIRFGISSSIFNNFTGSISKAYGYVQKLDKSLNDIRIVSGASAEQMDKFAKYANNAAKSLGSSTLDYTNAALIYYQQGLAEQQVQERADITVKMSNVLGKSADEVSNYMTAIWNNFDNGSKSLEYYADVLAKLGAETASSAEEISQGLEKFAAISKTVGLSYEYAAAALTTVTDRTRQSADVVGTAFKTLFARIQDLELGKTLDDGTTLGKYSEALESIGVNIKDQNGQLKSMDTILDEMGSKWKTLNNDQKVALAQNVAGVRQYTQLMSLMENWDFFQLNVDSARDATGALQKQQEIYLDSVEAHLEQLRTEAEKTYATLFDVKLIKTFTDALSGMLKVFNSFLTGLGGGLSSLSYFGSLAGNLLNKQIGSGISGMIQNQENKNYNASKLEASKQIANAGIANSSNEGKNTKDAYQANLDDVTALINAHAALDEESFNKFDTIRKEIAEERLEIAKIKDFGENSSKNSDQREADLAIQKKQVKEDVENYNILKDLIKETNDIEVKYKEELQEKEEVLKRIVHLIEEINGTTARDEEIFSSEEVKELEKITKRLSGNAKDIKITENEKNKILKAQNKVIIANAAEEKRQNEELQIQKQWEDKIGLKKKEQLNTEKQAQYAMDVTEKRRAVMIADITKGLTSVTSSITAIIGITETLFNPDLSGWERFKSILMVVATQAFVLWKNWDSIKSLPGNLITSLEAYNKKLKMGIEIKKASKAASLAEAGATEANTIAQNKNTQSKIANTGAEIINEGQKKKSIITTVIHTAKLWLENAALATKLFLIGAVAVALIALTVAIVKALSKETQLQKKIEETAEAAKKAKEAYNELNDKITGYQDARKAIDGLTEGTLEFYEAVIKSNEKAQELIDTLGLLPDQDYTFDTNGLITINQDSLKNKAYTQMQTAYGTQAANYQAKAEYTQQSREGGLESVYRSLSKDINSILKENGIKNYKWTSDMAQSLLKGENIQTEIQGELITLTKIVGDVEDNTATTCDLIKPIDISKAISANKANYERLSAQLANYQRMTADSYIRGTISQEDSEYYNNLTKGIQKQIQTIVAQSIFGKEEEYQQTRSKIIGYNAGQKDYMLPVPQPGEKPKPQTPREQALKLYESSLAKGQTGNIDNTAMEWYVENVLKAEKLDKGKYSYNGKESSARNILKDNNIDAAIARNAYNSNQAYQYAADLERKTRNASVSAGLKSDQADYVTEARLALETAKTSGTAANKSGPDIKTLKYDKIDFQDFNAMTSEEMEVLKDQIKSSFGTEYLIAFNDYLKEIGYEYDSIARKAADLQKYNDAMDVQAQSIGTTSTALKMYDAARQNAEKGNVSYKKSQAELAAAEFKFNKAYNEGRKAFKDNEKAFNTYMKALQKGKKVSYDVAEGAGAVVDSLKNMGLQLKTEDLKDPKTLKQIKTLLNGTAKEAEKAYKQLEKKSLANILTQDFGVAEDKVNSIIKKIQSMGDQEIKIKDLGLKKISGTAEEIRQKLANLGLKVNEEDLAKAKQQVADINSGKGSTADIKSTSVSEPVVSTITQSGRKYFYVDGNGDLQSKSLPDLTWTETKQANDVKFTLGKDTRVSYVGKPKNFTPSPATTNKGGGGGSKSKPQKAEKFKPETDIYHKVNTQITKVNNSLKKLQRQEEKTLGTKLLKNLQTQWNQISTQVDNYREKLKIAEKEQSKLQKKLAKSGVTFNEDGTVANYFETLQKLEDKIEAKRTKYNKERNKKSEKTNKARLEEIEKLKEQYNTLQEEMNRADELASDFIPGIKEAWNESLDQQVELNIKAFEIKIKYSADIKDLTTEVNDFIEKSINGLSEDNRYGNFKLNQKNMAASLTKDDNGNLIGHLADQTEQLIRMQAQYDQLRAQGASIFGDNDVEGWEKRKEQLEAFMEEYSGYIEAQKEQLSLIREQKEAIDDLMDTQLENYGKIGDQLEHNRKLMQLVYGESAASKIKEISKIQVTNAETQLNYAHQLNEESAEYLKTQDLALKNAKDQVDELAAAGDTESSLYQQAYNAMLEAEKNRDEAAQKSLERAEAEQEALNNYVDTINNDLVNAIDIALETLNNGLTESGKGLDYAREQWDLIDKEANIYLDTINSLQGQKDLESKYLESIEKATNPNVQKKLKAAMDAELKALKDKDTLTKYDLDRANKRYQIMLAQIALEEAQQNKNKMRLRRDSQGNYRYQYVADEENIKKAQDELTSLYTDLYNFDKERFLEVNNTILDIEADVQNKIKEIYADTTKSKEEKEQEAALVIQSYNDQILALQKERATAEKNVNESAFDDLKMLYGEDSEEYAKACEDKQKTMTELIPQLESEGNAIAYNTELVHKNEDAWHAAETAANNAADTITNKIVALEGPLDQLEQGVNKNIDAINKIIEQGVSKITEYKTQLTEMNTTLANNQALLKQLNEEKGIVDLVTKSWKDLTDVKKDAMDEVTKEENENGILTTDYNKKNASQNIENSGGESEPEKASENQGMSVISPKITNKFGQPATWTEVKKSKAKTKALQEFLMSIGIELPKYGADGSYGDETLTAVKKFQKQKLGMSSGDGKFGPDTWARAKAAGYDTGGYTGEWGNNGRLAFLHQKELVLNAQDTENILNTVAIMRNLMASMNESILSRLAGVTARSIQGLDSIGNNSGLEQNVHIEANFPNAISSNEIEEALRNLVNVASQRVTK